jgi:hypothetical protein
MVNIPRHQCDLELQSCSCFSKLNFMINLKQELCIPGQDFLLRKTGASLYFKIELGSLHISPDTL